MRHIEKDEKTGDVYWKSHKELETQMILNDVACKKLRAIPGQGQPSLSFDFGDGYDELQQRIDAYRLKNHEIGWIQSDNNNDNDNIID